MTDYTIEEVSPAEIQAELDLYTPLTRTVRELVDAVIRTQVDEDEIRSATAEIEAIVARLQKRLIPGSFGIKFTRDGMVRNHGNAVLGLRNAIAPPLVMQRDLEAKRVSSDFHLGAAYEGPPGLVHGGISALILDQVCGDAAASGGAPGMTGTLSLRYLRGTPLGALHAEAWIDRVEGVKTFVKGTIGDADGPTIECEGIFILPRWAREQRARHQQGNTPALFE